MTIPWLGTTSNEDLIDFSPDLWGSHWEQAGEFWTDRTNEFKNNPDMRFRIAIGNLPLPAAFREAAIAIRTIIRYERKTGHEYQDKLILLYWLAAVNSLNVPYSEILKEPGYNVFETIPGIVIKNLPLIYETLGYEKLDLLNKTDIHWIMELWGEPQFHSTFHILYKEIWNKYELHLLNN